jgi:transcriptional regulator with XRE-family HTH domain
MPKSEKTGSEELGRLIRARRQALGLRRRDLVDLTGLSYPYVSQIETGYRLPSDRAVRDLAAALQIDPGELLTTMPAERQVTPLAASASPPAGRSDGWFSNPAFSQRPAPSRPSSESPSLSEVVAATTSLLAQLPADARLDALAQVQRQLVEGLVREQGGGR